MGTEACRVFPIHSAKAGLAGQSKSKLLRRERRQHQSDAFRLERAHGANCTGCPDQDHFLTDYMHVASATMGKQAHKHAYACRCI
eukprot:1161729-Pelagomonas_calceolata.AAC.4